MNKEVNVYSFNDECYVYLGDYKKLQQENKELQEKYNKRSKKWEKWETEKSILSIRMSEYLCKYQNIKREYINQIANATKKKKEIEKLHNKIDKIEEWLEYKAEALDRFDIPKRKETGAFWFTTRGEIDGLLEILKGDVND